MAELVLDADNALYYDYTAPAAGGVTFVFFNALTGSSDLWLQLAPALTEHGHGVLAWNLRGQQGSRCDDQAQLNDQLISADARRLLDELHPPRPVLVGLSIGGLFAARTALQSNPQDMAGLVLINTLRRPNARLDWVNEAALRCAELGGLELVKDLFGPLIFNREWLAENRASAFQNSSYQGLTPADGHYRLLNDCRSADWALPYEQLTMPTLVLTGLQDNMFLDLDDVAEYTARLPNAHRVDMADAGHMLPLERSQAFIASLLDFSQSL